MLIPHDWVSLQFHGLLFNDVSMSQPSTENILLTSPLRWTTAQGLSGFVVGIGTQTLHLRSDVPMAQPSDLLRLAAMEVSMPDGMALLFDGALSGHGEQLQLKVESNVAKKSLQDLLNIIRKDQHIEICRDQNVESSDRFTGFDELQFTPAALPEVDFEDVQTETTFLGRRFSLPILITGMTGGIEKGAEINRRLALAAERFNIPMGIGSQRMALENPEYAAIFAVKKYAPKLYVIGNIGCSQLLRQDALSICQRAVDMIEADALAVHINILQECVQVEGDRHFKGILPQLEKLCQHLSVPVIVKEVGCGIDPITAMRLKKAGVAAIDVGGRGGTSWGYIEGLRANARETKDLANTFRNWGIPTAYSVAAIRQMDETFPLIATGGVRDGLTVAKAVALGANMVGIGLPLLRAALASEEEPCHVLRSLERGLKTTLVLTGSRTLAALSQRLTRGQPYADAFAARVQAPPVSTTIGSLKNWLGKAPRSEDRSLHDGK